MSVTAKPLITAKFASASNTTEYTAPSSTRTIIDKFTLTNTDSSARTVSIHIVVSGSSATDQFLIVKDKSIAAGASEDVTHMQNQILGAGEFISVVASVASKVVIRASGREVT